MNIWKRIFGKGDDKHQQSSPPPKSGSHIELSQFPLTPPSDIPPSDPSDESSKEDRAIRVFISSTFRDMMRERDLLVKQVFPALRRICAKRFVTFTEVDLRWGITEEQSAEGKVLPLCLAEIERSRPYFIGLLGERYGWIPDAIPTDVIEKEPWLKEHLYGRKSVTELEILHGVLNNPKMHHHAFFYFRDPAYVADTLLTEEERREMVERDIPAEVEKLGSEEAHRRTEERKGKLTALKQQIRDSKLPLVEPYENPEALAKIIEDQFRALIDRIYPEEDVPDELDRERLAHEAHAKNKLFACIERPAHLAAINNFAEVQEHDGRGLVVTGESGSGKTVLLAAWARDWGKSHPDDFLFQHYFGATPDSSSPDGFLRRLLGELKNRFDITEEIPYQHDKLREALPRWLAQTINKGRIILILDGLNQVQGEEPDKRLNFLPHHYPPNVVILASSLPGLALDVLRERGWAEHDLPLADEKEVDAMVVAYLNIHARALDASLCRELVTAPGSKNPLFLRTVLEELRQFGSFEKLPDQVRHYLEAGNPRELFLRVIRRWQTDFDAGVDLVSSSLSFLWAARQGLSESELLNLFGKNGEPLPRAYWTPFFLALEPYLSQRSGLFAFGHDFIRQAVETEFLSSTDDRKAAHLALAQYFAAQIGMSSRKAIELPWQWLKAQCWQDLARLLENLPFVSVAWDQNYYDIEMYWGAVRRHTGAGPHQSYRTIMEDPGKLAECGWRILRLLRDTIETKEHLNTSLWLCDHLIEEERKNCNSDLLRKLLAEKGVLLWGAEDYIACAAVYSELESHARNCGDLHRLQLALDGQANILERMGKIDAAIAKSEEAEKICRQDNNLPGLQCVLSNRATALIKLHRFDDALVLLREVEDISRTLGHVDGLIACLPKKVMATAELAEPSEWNIAELETPLVETENLARQFGKLGALIDSLKRHRMVVHAMARTLCEQSQWGKALELFRHVEPVCSELKELHATTSEDSLCIEDMVRCMINCAGMDCNKRDHSRFSFALANEAVQTAAKYSLSDLAQTCLTVLSIVKQWADYYVALEQWEMLSPSEQAKQEKPAEPDARLSFSDTELEGEPALLRTLAFNEHSYGENHPEVAVSLNNLAMWLKDTGRLTEAEPLMRRVLKIDVQHYGESHPVVARDLNNLTLLLGDLGRLTEAEPLIRRALAIDEVTYGKNHPKISIRLNNLANLLCATNRLSETEPIYRRALAIDEQEYGLVHPEVATDLNNLAELFRVTNRLTEAEPLYRRALAIDEKSYGSEHPDVARDLNNLALLLKATARLKEAEPLMKRVVTIFLNVTHSTGHPHPHLQNVINNYAGLLMQMSFSQQEIIAKLNELGREYGLQFGG
jgi:nephrocystin-3